jgi:hypothetical protein
MREAKSRSSIGKDWKVRPVAVMGLSRKNTIAYWTHIGAVCAKCRFMAVRVGTPSPGQGLLGKKSVAVA